MAILLGYLTSHITSFRSKSLSRPKNCGHLKFLKYQTQLQFDLRYEKHRPNRCQKSICHGDYVIDDVTGWPQSRSSTFLCK